MGKMIPLHVHLLFHVCCLIISLSKGADTGGHIDTCNLSEDIIGLNAIRWLHSKIDEDGNGNVDTRESDEFLREDLKLGGNYERRHLDFHGSDKLITADEMWSSWKRSEVYGWSVDETVYWLTNTVKLPQYQDPFYRNAIDGTRLPRLATNGHYLTSVLGISDPLDRHKIVLYAMDAILFGPVKKSWIRDVLLLVLIVTSVVFYCIAFHCNRNARKRLKRIFKDMESLQLAKEKLASLQEELDIAKEKRTLAALEKESLLKELKYAQNNNFREKEKFFEDIEDRRQELTEEIQRNREQLGRLREMMAQVHTVNSEMQKLQLQRWLQFTYEMEVALIEKEKEGWEKNLIDVIHETISKEQRKRKPSVFGVCRGGGGSRISSEPRVSEAKERLVLLEMETQRSQMRWQTIERFCQFSCRENPGHSYLEALLYKGTATRGSLDEDRTLFEQDSDSLSNSYSMIRSKSAASLSQDMDSMSSDSISIRSRSQPRRGSRSAPITPMDSTDDEMEGQDQRPFQRWGRRPIRRGRCNTFLVEESSSGSEGQPEPVIERPVVAPQPIPVRRISVPVRRISVPVRRIYFQRSISNETEARVNARIKRYKKFMSCDNLS